MGNMLLRNILKNKVSYYPNIPFIPTNPNSDKMLNATTRTVTQSTNYYPFGLAITTTGTSKNKYLYNGKELQPSNAYYDYGARMYDASVGRWFVVDPLTKFNYGSYQINEIFGEIKQHPSETPYSYVFNNPVNFFDIGGYDSATPINKPNPVVNLPAFNATPSKVKKPDMNLQNAVNISFMHNINTANNSNEEIEFNSPPNKLVEIYDNSANILKYTFTKSSTLKSIAKVTGKAANIGAGAEVLFFIQQYKEGKITINELKGKFIKIGSPIAVSTLVGGPIGFALGAFVGVILNMNPENSPQKRVYPYPYFEQDNTRIVH